MSQESSPLQGEEQPKQLFDLHADPGEQDDLAGDPQAGSPTAHLRDLLRDHVERERPGWLVDGDLPTAAVESAATRQWRASAWPGFHTEHHPIDVRH